MSWVPQPDGSSLCEEHGENFREPFACARCGPEHAESVDGETGEAEQAQADAIASGAKTSDEYEREFNADAALARRAAKKARSLGEYGNMARLLDTASKNRRAAYEICRDREDKAWVEKRKREELRGKRGDGRAPLPAFATAPLAGGPN